jgi:transcriptional regulator GlxA family with amidase domain
MVDDDVLDWLRKVHEATTWTASVCTGALILGAAAILEGLPTTTHWYKMGVLKIMGARPQPDQRIVRSGKIVTAAGVSAGIDPALLASRRNSWSRASRSDPAGHRIRPPATVQHSHMSKASKEMQKLAKEMMDDRMPADQRRLVPKIAWRRALDLIRTGR